MSMSDIKEDIKIVKEMLDKESSIYKKNKRGNKEIKFELNSNYYKAIEHILHRLEQDEIVIEKMAKAWKQDDIRSIEEIIDHFRKKCE